MKLTRSILLFLLVFVFVTSCKKDEVVSAAPGTLTLHFDNIVGDANLQLNTTNTPYTNANGEAFKVTWLTYYISNIKVKSADGKVFTDPVKSDGSQGYYLIDESDSESQDVILKNLPAGDYTEVTFTVGVDANQVDQGAQVGPLDPAKGLFWSWNSGYIFFAIEGVSPASTEANNAFQFHVGGYKEISGSATAANNIKTITLSFDGNKAAVNAAHEPEVHLLLDVKKFFNGAGAANVSFATNAARHSPASCKDVAGNVPAAFTFDHIHAN